MVVYRRAQARTVGKHGRTEVRTKAGGVTAPPRFHLNISIAAPKTLYPLEEEEESKTTARY